MNPFRYPADPLQRRHGPQGYASAESYRPWLRDEFSFRCIYCLFREQWGRIRKSFELDHFQPVSLDPALSLDYDNLLYTCASCNSAKRNRAVPDPGSVFVEEESVVASDDGRLIARTPDARRLIEAIQLNSDENIELRRLWIDIVALAKRYDPALFQRLMGYPEDMPDLSRLRPPGSNSRPEGIAQSQFARRERGELATIY